MNTYSGTGYQYYMNGLRRSKYKSGQGYTYYIWLDGDMVYEFTSNTSHTYTYGHRLLYSDTYNYVLNAHGDVVALLNSSGTVVKRYEYDAFGTEFTPSSTDTNPFRYCAEYFDTESGQIYLRARYYQPRNGRFSQLDPARDGTNWYVYCYNNPILWIDPSGRSGEIVLSIYSDQNNSHSFIVIENNSDNEIIVGNLPVDAGDFITVGTFGNRIVHKGVFYNIEANNKDSMDSYVYLQMDITDDELSDISSFILNNDRWSIYNNCSSFASRLWNSVSDIKLSAGVFWNTPSNLAKSIMENHAHGKDRFFDTVETVYMADGKKYSIDSLNSINSKSSNSALTGRGEYITPVSSSDSSSGYSSSVSVRVQNSSVSKAR